MKRSYGILCFIAALMVPLSALSQTKVTIGYSPANDFLAAFVAKDKGFFAKRGLDVTLTRIANGSTIPAAMVNGSITVGGITPPLFMQANENGIDLRILAGASIQSSKNPTASVVVRNGVDVKSPADFVGKRVGVPGLNSVMHVMFVKWLRTKNVDPAKVTFVEAPFPQQVDLMKGGQVDAALPVEPFRSRIVQSGSGKAFANFFSDVRDNTLFSFYAITADWAKKNPKETAALREALAEGAAFIQSQPAEAKQSQIVHLGLPPQIIESLPLATYETRIDLKDVSFWIDLSRDLGITKAAYDAKRLIAE